MLYADDLVLKAELRAEVLERFESKGLKVNIQNTKVLVSENESESVVSFGTIFVAFVVVELDGSLFSVKYV